MFLPLKDTNPPLRRPVVTPILIVLNIGIFILGTSYSIEQFAFYEAALKAGTPQGFTGLVTYQFLHGGWGHLIGNMWFLYIFGDNVEASFGRLRFLGFYLVCGIVSALAEVYLDPTFGTEVPGVLVGASGSISGVLGAYILRYPRAKILTWFIWIAIGRIQAVWYILIWIGLQFLYQVLRPESNVAYLAHIGGFMCGLIIYWLYHSFRMIKES